MDAWSIVIGVVTGIGTGVISSFIFLSLFSRLKPRIEISRHIAKDKTAGGRVSYRIKVINRTHRIGFINRSGDPLMSGQEIRLRRDEIPKLSHLDNKDQKEKYAFRFITEEDLDVIWTDTSRQFLRFTISATDSLSNLEGVSTHDYDQKDKSRVFQPGNFSLGDTFRVYSSRTSSTAEHEDNIEASPVEGL